MAIPEVIGKYRTIKTLGEGGFGAVYLAEDPKLNDKVAIKVFAICDATLVKQVTGASDGEEGLRERFVREAMLLRQLSANPNIVDVYEFDEMPDGTPYFVMPFLEHTLIDDIGKDVLTPGALGELPADLHPRKLPLLRVIDVLTEILLGLMEVHKAALVHRDIKPANILFDMNGRVQLCDFGVAKTPDSQHSETGMMIGSRNYMSPEQRESGKHVTPRSDVYSVGVVAYRMLTGSLPTGPCDDPIVFCPEMGEELNTLILDSLSVKPENRPVDAGDFLHRLRKIVQTKGGEEVGNVTEVGPAPGAVRKELQDLEQTIERFLLEGASISTHQYKQLRMMAAIENVTDDALQHLIDRAENKLSGQLTPTRQFIALVEEALSHGKGALTEQALAHLQDMGRKAGLDRERVNTVIEKRRVIYGKHHSKKLNLTVLPVLFASVALFFCMGLIIWFLNSLATPSNINQNEMLNQDEQLESDQTPLASNTSKPNTSTPSNVISESPTLIDEPAELSSPTVPMPRMLSIPGGVFLMGAKGYSKHEQPVHEVFIGPFQLGETEVTWQQYRLCIDAGFCSHKMADEGLGRSEHPVINVSWYNVQTYITWLNKQTGRDFRLPTEAEWEYAARAGTLSNYYWGDDIGFGNANCDGCGSQWDDKQTAPVASFSANAFGLFDMHGNVWEWVQDCWNDNYEGAPSDGTAWQVEGCRRRVLRGGSWHNVRGYLRSAYRSADSAVNSYFNFGFRLAHDK